MSRYVKKEAFIALLNKRIYCLCGGETVKETRNIRDMLEVFPAADVKPVVRGEWITVSESAWDGGEYKCSACGWECCDDEFGDDPTEDYRFCPNCGADMRKEAKDE